MALKIDENGTIEIVQGDSGEVVVSGLNPNINYDVYFAIQNLKRKTIGSELKVQSNMSDTVTFILTPAYTDLLTVPLNKDYEIYRYGIKLCAEGTEDTVTLVDRDYGVVNELIVYPKTVEGA